MSTGAPIAPTGTVAAGLSTGMYNKYVQAVNAPAAAPVHAEPRSSPSGTPEKPKKWKTVLKQMMFGKKEKRVFILH